MPYELGIIRTADASSSVLTYVMFLFVFYEICQDGVQFCHYNTQTFWTGSSEEDSSYFENVLPAVEHFKEVVDGACNTKNANMTRMVKTWGNETYKGVYVNMENSCYNPLILLQYMFFFSYLFQFYRCYTIEIKGYDQVSTGVDANKKNYNPSSGPQFFRWLEYALTSPLMVVIIATSFFISDTSVLVLLGGLQGAVILLGYGVETFLHLAGKDKDDPELYSSKAIYLFLSAWAFHGIIWWVLIDRFNREKYAVQDCGREMPAVVDFIIWSQFTLFTLFGAVQTAQVVYVASFQGVENTWLPVTLCYSLLSVFAKTMLGFSFIAFVKLQA